MVVVYSFNASKYGNWEGFSLEWYEKLFRNTQIMRSLKNSLFLAVSSCALSILIGTAGAVGMAKSRFRAQNLLENVSLIPMMLPEIILGMAYLSFFSILQVPFGMVTLIIAHTTFCVPYIFINVQSRLVGLDPAYVEAARDLGASPFKAFLTVTVPLTVPGIVAGCVLVFVPSMGLFFISDLLGGSKTLLLGNLIKNEFMQARNWPMGATLSIAMLVFTTVFIYIYKRVTGAKTLGGLR